MRTYALCRTLRTLCVVSMYPDHPLSATTLMEIASTITPITLYPQETFGVLMALTYAPTFASTILQIWEKSFQTQLVIEIFSLTVLIIASLS